MIDKWPSLADFAADIGVEYGTAKQMRRRDSVAGRYWLTMQEAAKRRAISDVTVGTLAAAAAAQSPSFASRGEAA
ncbi:hypothetical protein ASG43_03125 [Aureimonas sp. Leaf454]|nr:hypothetical protein ASG43_03125 [Aureimonas sp. Leaf454]